MYIRVNVWRKGAGIGRWICKFWGGILPFSELPSSVRSGASAVKFVGSTRRWRDCCSTVYVCIYLHTFSIHQMVLCVCIYDQILCVYYRYSTTITLRLHEIHPRITHNVCVHQIYYTIAQKYLATWIFFILWIMYLLKSFWWTDRWI